jgi:CubicO group peptidase (beta-lactamase class C family)
MSNLDYDIPIGPDSIFDVGQIAMQFTALSIGLLMREGRLSPNDDVRKYLPELPAYPQTITVRHLLTHTSGLPDALNLLDLAGGGEYAITENDVLRMISRQRALDFVPGAESFYNYGGYILLASIVKRVSGQSQAEFAKARIFTPLGMNDTHFIDDHTLLLKRRTSAYRQRQGGGWKVSLPLSDIVGTEGLYTTVGDLAKWEQNFVDASVGGRDLLDEMQKPARLNDGTETDFGFGLGLGTYRGLRTIAHGGHAAGYLASLVRFPDQHLVIALLCNHRSINTATLASRVADIALEPGLLGPVESLAPAVPAARAELATLAGTYWNPLKGVLQLSLNDGRLLQGNSELVPLGNGRFRAGTQPGVLFFPTPKTGAPQQIHRLDSERAAVYSRVDVASYSATGLKVYVGNYYSRELDETFRVEVRPDGHLAVLRRRSDAVQLTGLMRETFYAPSLGTIRFVRALSGDVAGFSVSNDYARRVSFARLAFPTPAAK